MNTVDFVYRCFLFYGYKPEEIQTDNGIEFTWNQEKFKKNTSTRRLMYERKHIYHKIKPEHQDTTEKLKEVTETIMKDFIIL